MHTAVVEHPFGRFKAPLARHQGRRMILLEAEHMRPDLPANFQQIAETFGYQKGDLAAAALDQGIGGNRGAVGEAADLRQIQVAAGQFIDPVQDRPCRVIRRRWCLVQAQLAAFIIVDMKVRKCAADIDPDDP